MGWTWAVMAACILSSLETKEIGRTWILACNIQMSLQLFAFLTGLPLNIPKDYNNKMFIINSFFQSVWFSSVESRWPLGTWTEVTGGVRKAQGQRVKLVLAFAIAACVDTRLTGKTCSLAWRSCQLWFIYNVYYITVSNFSVIPPIFYQMFNIVQL